MKASIKLFISIILFSFNVNSLGQELSWEWLHPKPQGNNLDWVKIWDQNNWYAAGYGGTFMKTTNAGTTWSVIHNAGIYDSSIARYNVIWDGWFFDQSTGIICGTKREICRTVDGGVTWDCQEVGSTSGAVWLKMHFISGTTGYAVGTTGLAKTTDAGLSWSLITTIPSGSYTDVYSANDSLLLVSTTTGAIQRSTDGGLTWNTVPSNLSAWLYCMEFIDINNGWVTELGKAAYTTNA